MALGAASQKLELVSKLRACAAQLICNIPACGGRTRPQRDPMGSPWLSPGPKTRKKEYK